MQCVKEDELCLKFRGIYLLENYFTKWLLNGLGFYLCIRETINTCLNTCLSNSWWSRHIWTWIKTQRRKSSSIWLWLFTWPLSSSCETPTRMYGYLWPAVSLTSSGSTLRRPHTPHMTSSRYEMYSWKEKHLIYEFLDKLNSCLWHTLNVYDFKTDHKLAPHVKITFFFILHTIPSPIWD